MSIVEIRVELPTYSRTFHVHVLSSCTVLDVKHAIFSTCPGAPRVDGQRLLCRGRLLADHERVEDIWKNPNDIPVVLLAVGPTSWTTSPTEPSSIPQNSPAPSTRPTLPGPSPLQFTRRAQSTPSRPSWVTVLQSSSRYGQPPMMPTSTPLPYISMKHQNALSALTTGHISASVTADYLEFLKQQAKVILAQHGYSWPAIFDELWPPHRESDKGVTYQRTRIDGQDYLQLVDDSATPTPLQVHALNVLSHTFPLLSIPFNIVPPHSISPPSQSFQMPPGILNAHLQQLGLPQLHVQPEHAAMPEIRMVPEIRIIPLRALLTPMLALAFRLSFLMLFFSPFQNPVISILLGLYLILDAALTIYNVILRDPEENEGRDRAARDGANADGAGGAAGFGNGDRQVAQQDRLRRGGAGRAGTRDSPFHWLREQSDPIVDYLAKINLRSEAAALDSRGTPATKPTIGHRVRSFFVLMALTLYPEIWNRRRTALRQREGRIKTEANARVAPPASSPQSEGGEGGEEDVRAAARERARVEIVAAHDRRPGWVKEYVERVVEGDWVDE